MQDKLRVLAEWLHVSADELRFGTLAPISKSQGSGADMTALTMQDRDMLAKYDLVGGRSQNRLRCGAGTGGGSVGEGAVMLTQTLNPTEMSL